MQDDFFVQIGERLKAERMRLDIQQMAFAESCNVSRGALLKWEKGEAAPNASVLSVMAGLGVDVLYVVTGARASKSANTLSPAERLLLDSYNQADEAGRTALQAVAALAGRAAGAPGKSGNTVTIGGDVGQSIAGDQHNTGPVSFSVEKRRK